MPRRGWTLRAGTGCRGAGAVLLLALLALAPVAADSLADPPDGEARVEQARQQLKQLRHEREQLRLNLEAYRDSEARTLEQVEDLAGQVRAAKRRERELQGRHKALLAERDGRGQRLRGLRGEIRKIEARIAGNLVNVYRLAKVADAASLLAFGDYRSYFKDSRYLALLTDLDREALERRRQLRQDLVDAQRAAQSTLDELAVVMESLAAEQVQLAESEQVLRESLEEIRRDQELSQSYLAELDQTVGDLEQALGRMESAPATRSLNTLPSPAKLKGSLPPPTAGRIIARFGEQDPRYALEKDQRGIVVDVGEGTEVKAVTAGRVVHAGPFRGYQQLVVLEHGHGLFTVYGYLDGVTQKKGAWIDTGTVLGQAAYQPAIGSYNVYFEVRLRGTPEDPQKWLRPDALPLAQTDP